MNERTFHARDAHKLEDPERLKWLPPDEVITRIGIVPGMIIADIGAGTGTFALPFANAVGKGGRVIAVDIQREMLEILSRKIAAPGAPGNVVLLEGEALHTSIEGGRCDLVFMGNIWHELDDVAGVLGEAKRVLRPRGRLAILDWRKDLLPPPGPPSAHRVSIDDARNALVQHGWSVTQAENLGKNHYLLSACT